MKKDQECWKECSDYLASYLASGDADIALVNKCKTDAEKRYCISYLYDQKKNLALEPNESISNLEAFLNEL